MSTSSGTITVRDQYDTFERWKKNQRGRCMISTGITGVARHGTWPNSANWTRQNTLARSAPPIRRMQSRGRHHMRRVHRIADRLQCEIRLDADGKVRRAIMEQWPAALAALDAA